MIYLKKGLIFLWRCWFILLNAVVVLIVGWFVILFFLISPKTHKIAYFLVKTWVTIVFYGSGFRYSFERKVEQDPKKSYMVICNHTSMIDIYTLFLLQTDMPAFVGKSSLRKIPVFGKIFEITGILVDRSNAHSRAMVYKKAFYKIRKGLDIIIFPEGKVPDDTSIVLDEFKDGAFSIAIATKIPVAVYTICGLKKMFPFSWTEGYPGKFKVKLLEIVETKDLTQNDFEELKKYCRNLMLEDLKKCPSA